VNLLRVVLILGLIVPNLGTANAQTYLTIPIASWHADKTRDDGKGSYEQTNFGLGLEYAYTKSLRVEAGLYRNSLRTDTGYVGIIYAPFYLQSANVRVGTSIGLVSGYEKNLIPLLVPTLMWEWKGFGVNILFIPPSNYTKSAGAGFQLKIRLP